LSDLDFVIIKKSIYFTQRRRGAKLILENTIKHEGVSYDLKAAEIRNLHWLIASPKMSQVVIGDDGHPAAMTVPDPRSFALHKLWLSEQPDRESVKKQRDCDQGIAVSNLIVNYLPQYKFNASELRMFPKTVFSEAKKYLSDQGQNC
jgi:hypothetical protein